MRRCPCPRVDVAQLLDVRLHGRVWVVRAVRGAAAGRGAGGAIDGLHATFEQHCEGASPALRGEVAIAANPWR